MYMGTHGVYTHTFEYGRKPDLDALSARITRFLVYAAAVKTGRIGKGSATRFLAMEGDKASKRKRAKKKFVYLLKS